MGNSYAKGGAYGTGYHLDCDKRDLHCCNADKASRYKKFNC